jgi:hypothetical protein
MKTKITTAALGMGLFLTGSLSAQYDLSIGNVSAGWNTYNSGTGVITGVYFDVLNNENNNPGSFDVKVYLVDPNNSSNSWAVWSYTDGDGQNGNTVVTYDNIDIDFNNTPGIPAGQYRLAVCVDPDNAITETDDNNNCLYISTMGNNLTYSPGTAGITNVELNQGIAVYPNPFTSQVNFIQENGVENARVTILNMSGQVLKTMGLNVQFTQMDLSDLETGLYIYQVLDANGTPLATGKLVKK